jgi:hypothetical protein
MIVAVKTFQSLPFCYICFLGLSMARTLEPLVLKL